MGECRAFARIYNIDNFDIKLERFQSSSFSASSSDGGVSVIYTDCSIAASGSICAHIRQHYNAIARDPPIFWELSRADIPGDARIEQKTVKGDVCHHNLMGIKRGDCERLVKKRPITDYRICDPDGAVAADVEKLINLKKMLAI